MTLAKLILQEDRSFPFGQPLMSSELEPRGRQEGGWKEFVEKKLKEHTGLGIITL